MGGGPFNTWAWIRPWQTRVVGQEMPDTPASENENFRAVLNGYIIKLLRVNKYQYILFGIFIK